MAIILLAGIRSGFGLQAHIRREHFSMLGRLLVAMSLVMTLVYATEFFMAFYRGGAAEREVFHLAHKRAVRADLLGVVACKQYCPAPLFLARVRCNLPRSFPSPC